MFVNPEYDPRYLAGILLFNRRDFFDAHEVWEDLWQSCPQEPRRFYQSLIQAAVAVYHANNGNAAGARRLFSSGRKYMSAYSRTFLGLDVTAFWQQLEQALHPFLIASTERISIPLDGTLLPRIDLHPAPSVWPDPAMFFSDNESVRG